MTLILHEHPFAAYCWKALIALDELELPFERHFVGDADDRARLAELWPMASIPVLVDDANGLTIPESTTIVEYLDGLAGGSRLIPPDGLEARLWDRILDGHVATPMQKIVGDSLRPDDARDPHGVEEAHEALERAYALLDDRLADRTWMAGRAFTLADCAAAPALHYGWVVHPWQDRPALTRYFERLTERPSVARVIDDARPYRDIFPLGWPAHAA
jgi:glutathione S-transferase